MNLGFTQEQYANISQCFGEVFAQTLPKRVADYAKRWSLFEFSLIEYYSVNCLFTCRSEHYGDCVLKVFGCAYEWYIDEINALNELDGNCNYVQVYESDESCGALLLERINPGVTLKIESSLDKRISMFMKAWRNAHIAPQNPSLFKSYLKTAENAAIASWADGDISELRQAAQVMVDLCYGLYRQYPERMLLHADLHGDNLIMNTHGEYTIVDPHGRIGPPICDLGRYIANEYADANSDIRSRVIEYVITQLSESLNLPRIDVIRAFFVDITLMTCWDAENGAVDIDGVIFASNLLEQGELKAT